MTLEFATIHFFLSYFLDIERSGLRGNIGGSRERNKRGIFLCEEMT
jgi:hypothetical protein